MSVFILPISLWSQLNLKSTNFWWVHLDNHLRIHWKIWNVMCSRKSHGGLGFRDIHSFNLLDKQVWRFLMCLDLIPRLFKTKYYPNTTILNVMMDQDLLISRGASLNDYLCSKRVYRENSMVDIRFIFGRIDGCQDTNLQSTVSSFYPT